MGGQVAFALVPLFLRRWHYQWVHRDLHTGTIWLDILYCCRPNLKLSHENNEGRMIYRATTLLIKVIIIYALVFNILSVVFLVSYASTSSKVKSKLEDLNVTSYSFALFTTVSAFNNAGFSVFSNSLVPFRDDPLVLFVAMVLIVAGNTAFPILLRTTFILLYRWWKPDDVAWKSLIENPRAYTTHMFSHNETWILFLVFLGTNIFQFVLYSSVPYSVPLDVKQKVLDMLFTTISTRTAGFNVVRLDDLNPGILVCQMLFMYLASYPIIVAVQSTSVEDEFDVVSTKRSIRKTSKGTVEEMKKTLSSDIIWLAAVTAIIGFDKYIQLETLFRLIWEVVSAYGTVGTSLSLPTNVSSFSSGFSSYAKLATIAVMIVGRHRSVPRNIDAAVDSIVNAEDVYATKRKALRLSQLEMVDHAHTIGHCTNLRPNMDIDNLFFDDDSSLEVSFHHTERPTMPVGTELNNSEGHKGIEESQTGQCETIQLV
eukprot:CAMPEP_0204839746 /NCGR_PEP_ID=MMETSP1346-20131115/35388_1 /ASSEMBLY_ACC=CAM_ASM_000771 /TAXON_ID=215587 /ORGANISM="Aplanochytrium stocchinoi, Strain GSBS06" /LENGTH=483 /DNA_ID=CAMNT_0051976719 /DNA_START=394 /DNA_END=1845 /DNA_ORIENTATION=+